MQSNPYITITGNVSHFDSDERSFTISPSQYIILTHTAAPFPIHAHFADTNSKKRWGPEGPKVAVGSTITLGGSLQRIVRERNIDRTFEFAQVEVTTIAYLGTRGNLAGPASRTSFHLCISCHIHSQLLFLFRRSIWESKKQKTMDLERSSKTDSTIIAYFIFCRRSFVIRSKKKET